MAFWLQGLGFDGLGFRVYAVRALRSRGQGLAIGV